MNPRWRIQELAEVVVETLAATGVPGQPSARVRDVPDLRTIRYYTTLGLLDRPMEMRGRVAYYGWRHARQLLAIKRLQASGASLVEIQARLAGATDRALNKLARVPDGLALRVAATVESKSPAKQSPPAAATRRADFWAEPAAVSANVSFPPSSLPAFPATHVKLGDGVTLVLEGPAAERLDHVTLEQLAPDLAALSNTLRRLGVSSNAKPRWAETNSACGKPTGVNHGSSRSSPDA